MGCLSATAGQASRLDMRCALLLSLFDLKVLAIRPQAPHHLPHSEHKGSFSARYSARFGQTRSCSI